MQRTLVLLLFSAELSQLAFGQPSSSSSSSSSSSWTPRPHSFQSSCAAYTDQESCMNANAARMCGWCSPSSTFSSGSACCIDNPSGRSGQSCSCNSSVNVFSVALLLAGAVAFILCVGMLVRRCVLRQQIRQLHTEPLPQIGLAPAIVPRAQYSRFGEFPSSAQATGIVVMGDPVAGPDSSVAANPTPVLPACYAPPTHHGYADDGDAAALEMHKIRPPAHDSTASSSDQRQGDGEVEAGLEI